jgi:hypothetical protein
MPAQLIRVGRVVYLYNPSTLGGQKQEDHEFKTMGYLARLCLKKSRTGGVAEAI